MQRSDSLKGSEEELPSGAVRRGYPARKESRSNLNLSTCGTAVASPAFICLAQPSSPASAFWHETAESRYSSHSCANSGSSEIRLLAGWPGRAAPEGSSFFRTPQRVVFFAISGLKWAMSWASLTGFSSMIAPSIDGSEASSNDPDSMIMGTPCSRRRPIKLSDRSPPRRWRSTIATSGRWQASKTSASAMVAAGPATVAPQSSRAPLPLVRHPANLRPRGHLDP